MTDISIIQALFDTQPIGEAFNWPVDVERFVAACRALRTLCQDEDSDPDEIAGQWRKLTAALGVEAVATLLSERGEWQKLVYDSAGSRKPWREHDDYVVVWDQPGGCVVATIQENGDIAESVTFSVRDKV